MGEEFASEMRGLYWGAAVLGAFDWEISLVLAKVAERAKWKHKMRLLFLTAPGQIIVFTFEQIHDKEIGAASMPFLSVNGDFLLGLIDVLGRFNYLIRRNALRPTTAVYSLIATYRIRR